ncbi:hypothetical protein I2750_16495 [Bacillus sp. PR5]|nr:hypothetical protein [Bacillus sp. PR5]
MFSNLSRASLCTWSGHFRSSVSYRTLALAGAALALGLTGTANAANFTASNETELVAAINQANASGDASSTITLTGGLALSGAPLPQITKNLTIDSAGNTITSARTVVLDVSSGTNLTYNGKIAVTGSNRFTVSGAGTVTLTGSDTVVNGNGGMWLGSSDGATLNLENGSKFLSGTLVTIAQAKTDSAVLNVTGAGSLLEGPVRVEQGNAVINIRNGGQISGSAVHIGVTTSYTTPDANNPIDRGGSADILVSDAGSRWDSTNPFILLRGSLSILNSGVVQAGSMRIGFSNSRVTSDAIAEVLVSGAGSQLITTNTVANSFAIGGGTGNFVKKGVTTRK